MRGVSQDSIKDPSRQNQFAPHFLPRYFLSRYLSNLGIVGAPDKDKMDQDHADG
jgi:hypothetical protein